MILAAVVLLLTLGGLTSARLGMGAPEPAVAGGGPPGAVSPAGAGLALAAPVDEVLNRSIAAAQTASPTPKTDAPSTERASDSQPWSWLQNFRTTALWSSAGAEGAEIASAPQWSYFQYRGEVQAGRMRLLEPGDGVRRFPRYVWASADDFGPSGPPSTEWELAADDGLRAGGLAAPRPMAESWPPGLGAEFVAVIDGDSGALLFGKNAHRRVAMASLTKTATAIVALERGRLDDRVTVDVDSRWMWESTVMGLTPGETVSLETLLYGLMLPSGNDAALAIARHIGGSEERFVDLMNAKARDLSLTDTQFRNPHGLDASGHHSSAYDQAMLARHGLRDANFYRLSAAREWNADGYRLVNLNRLLWTYPGADGVKVGFTDDAGRSIVGSATRDGRRVIVAMMRSWNTVAESSALLDWAFRTFRW